MPDILNMHDWDGLTYTNREDAQSAADEASEFFDNVNVVSVYAQEGDHAELNIIFYRILFRNSLHYRNYGTSGG